MSNPCVITPHCFIVSLALHMASVPHWLHYWWDSGHGHSSEHSTHGAHPQLLATSLGLNAHPVSGGQEIHNFYLLKIVTKQIAWFTSTKVAEICLLVFEKEWYHQNWNALDFTSLRLFVLSSSSKRVLISVLEPFSKPRRVASRSSIIVLYKFLWSDYDKKTGLSIMLGLTVMSRVWQHVAHRPMSAAPGCPRVLITIPGNGPNRHHICHFHL